MMNVSRKELASQSGHPKLYCIRLCSAFPVNMHFVFHVLFAGLKVEWAPQLASGPSVTLLHSHSKRRVHSFHGAEVRTAVIFFCIGINFNMTIM